MASPTNRAKPWPTATTMASTTAQMMNVSMSQVLLEQNIGRAVPSYNYGGVN